MSEDRDSGIDNESPEGRLDRFLGDGKLDDDELEVLEGELSEYDMLPPEEKNERRKVFLSEFYRKTIEVEATSGPIPPPGMLARYEEVLPGSADRILTMAERQQAHRFQLEDEALSANISSERRGTHFAGVIAIMVVLCATYLIANGKSAEGLSIILPSLAAIVGLFLHEQASAKKELVEKKEQAESNDIEGRES